MQARHLKLSDLLPALKGEAFSCKLGGRDLALIAIKLMQEKGTKEVTDVHVETFVKIVKKYCKVFREKYSAESPCHHKSEQFPSSFNEK